MAAVRPQGPDLLSPDEVSTLAHFSSPGWEPSAEQPPVTSAGGFWEFGLAKPPEFTGVLVLLQTTRKKNPSKTITTVVVLSGTLLRLRKKS